MSKTCSKHATAESRIRQARHGSEFLKSPHSTGPGKKALRPVSGLPGEILSQINKNRGIQKLEVISMGKERMGENLLFALASIFLIEPGRLETKKKNQSNYKQNKL